MAYPDRWFAGGTLMERVLRVSLAVAALLTALVSSAGATMFLGAEDLLVSAVAVVAASGSQGAVDAERPALRVLLVEAEPLVQRALVRQLRRHGVSVVPVSSVPAACELLAADSDLVDVVVTARHLPEVSGVALVAWLHQRPRRPPILMFTSDVDRTLTPAPDAFLEKPATPEALYDALARLAAANAEAGPGS